MKRFLVPNPVHVLYSHVALCFLIWPFWSSLFIKNNTFLGISWTSFCQKTIHLSLNFRNGFVVLAPGYSNFNFLFLCFYKVKVEKVLNKVSFRFYKPSTVEVVVKCTHHETIILWNTKLSKLAFFLITSNSNEVFIFEIKARIQYCFGSVSFQNKLFTTTLCSPTSGKTQRPFLYCFLRRGVVRAYVPLCRPRCR